MSNYKNMKKEDLIKKLEELETQVKTVGTPWPVRLKTPSAKIGGQ